PSASCYRCFWKKADSLGCEVWEVKPEPRGEDFDDENQRICRSVIENVLRIDLLPDQLESALAVQLPLRAQVLTKYELQIASQRCLPPRLANAAKADSPTIHLPDTSPAKGHAGENSHKTSLSQNGVANPSSSSSPPVGAGMVGEMMALNTPHGVIVDVGHNETAVERLLQFVGHHYFGMPVRLVLSLSTGRSLSMLQPVINYLSFPRNNRLLRLHFVEADHERGLSAVSVLQELQTSDSITAALRTELLAGLEEQHGAVLKMRQERKTFSQGEGDLTGKIASKTVEGMRIDAVSTLSNRRKKDLHTPEEIEDISEPYRHLLDTCQAGNLPDVLRFAYRQATAEGSLLVVGGTFFMMREVVDTLGFLRGAVDEIDMNETSVASARSLPPYSSSS
ncbi:dihydrofolate synthase folylpolyglutamate synthase, partial [Cystoisospora suis]